MDYNKIKKHFESGRWNSAMVKNAVKKGVITQAECDAILTGKELEQVSEQDFIDSIIAEVCNE